MFKRKVFSIVILLTILLGFSGCDLLDELLESVDSVDDSEITLIAELKDTDYFRPNALEHILEGELNRKGQAVGFHYDRLPTKKGEIISGTKTDPDEHGVYEAKVIVEDVEKTSNQGKSTFFPDEWDTQDVVDAINEAYDAKTFISGNTYEGLTAEGIIVRMYLDDQEKIISAFPVY